MLHEDYPSSDPYQITRWSRGFFGVDDQGQVVFRGGNQNQHWPIHDLLDRVASDEIHPPLLVRFPDIIRSRVDDLYQAFQNAIDQFDYQSTYNCVYPVKVNQNQSVVKSVLQFGQRFGIGLEAGSKAELMLVITGSDPSTPILYNGFKDDVSIEMAIRASRMGRDITIIIEKPNEIELIAAISAKLNHRPRLGIRVKLSSRGSGHWEHSGGLRSKFGLFVPQLLAAVEILKQFNLLDSFQLLHFHPGSQINDILRIKASVIEATRIYCDLKNRGVPLDTIDVGGGLAVDYTGQQSTDSSSMNYSLQEYANDIVYYVNRVCLQSKTPVPQIISESGRALVAHHAMMVIPVIGSSYRDVQADSVAEFDSDDRSLQPLVELRGTLDEINPDNLLESFHDAQQAIDMTLQLFGAGMISLEHRAIGERLFWNVCRSIREELNTRTQVSVELDSLRNLFAETYIANFSLFHSLRDHWAIDHLFPIVPLQRLGERPTIDAVLGDITCDSDGKINRFIDGKTGRSTLPVHTLRDGQDYMLGVFLVGAYQEAIGEQHNLLGRPNVATAEEIDGRLVATEIQRGDTLADMLRFNDPNWSSPFDGEASEAFQQQEDAEFFRRSMSTYCYLNPAESACRAADRSEQPPIAEMQAGYSNSGNDHES